uniref:Rab proteins geranylgeranyltransferase component A n=1 Tax=Xiphophorus couchianus TaxID=32473 RepID=A0A3B5MIJ8_9TELE
MATEDLPSDFDIVILGLAESVVAAACSRVGQRVLHLDRRSYYAANWASFTFNGLLTWIQEQNVRLLVIDHMISLTEEGEELIHLSQADSASITNLQVFSYASALTRSDHVTLTVINQSQANQAEGEEPEADQPHPSSPGQSEPSREKISYAQLVKEGRRFNIDLVSKLMFSRGSLVDLLIKSNVSRYAEFKNVTRILTYRHGNIEQVPCSRADVFASRQLSVVEKRKLMRFLTSCVEETEEQTAYHGRPYLEFLRDQQLGDNLQHFLLHSIAMVAEDTPTEEGLASTRHFLRSLGRYGNTPFLFPVYGLGEIPQCFCRMSAVFGGIYCLRHSVHCLIVDRDANRCKAVIDSRGQRISCKHLVMMMIMMMMVMVCVSRFLSRAVLITDSSVLPSESNQQVTPPSAGSPQTPRPLISRKASDLCPASLTPPHLAQSPHVVPLSPDRRPSVLWSLYFNMADGMASQVEGQPLPSNVHICHGPDSALGHEDAVQQAASIFQRILPEEEFCPPAPNPEDIVYDGDNSSTGEDRGDMGQDDGQNPEQNQNQENPDPEQNQNQENRNQNQENPDPEQNQNQENRNQNQENPDQEQNQNQGNPELQRVGPEEPPSSS